MGVDNSNIDNMLTGGIQVSRRENVGGRGRN